jgi:type I restriction enzyme, S subunit
VTDDLPKGWAWATLGDIADSTLGKMLDRGKERGGQRVPYLRNVNVQWGRIDVDDLLEMEMSADEQEFFSLRKGDLLVCEGGEVGRAAIWNAPIEGVAFQKALHRVRPLGSVDSKYLMYFFRFAVQTGELLRYVTGSTIKHLPQRMLKQVRIPVPPLTEQRRIVATLEDHLSRAEAATDYLVSAKKKLARWAIDATYRLTHPNNLDVVELLAIAEVRLGRQRSPKNHSGDSMRPYIRAANVGWSGLILDDVKEMNFTDGEAEIYQLQSGDIILGEASGSPGEVGKPALWRGEIEGCCFQNTLIRVRPRKVEPEFVYHYLWADAARGEFVKHSRGVGIHHIGSTRLRSWPVHLPSTLQQRKIAEEATKVLEESRRANEVIEAAKKRSEQLWRSVLREAFEGRLVQQGPNDEPASVLLQRIHAERVGAPRTRRGCKPNMTAAPTNGRRIDTDEPMSIPVPNGTQSELELGL